MNTSFIMQGIRSNWYLLVIAVVCFGLAAYKLSNDDGVAGEAMFSDTMGPMAGVKNLQDQAVSVESRSQEKVKKTIDAYEKRIASGASDAPVLRAAIGNLLITRLGDYQGAARNYELLLMDHPDYPDTRSVYINLATCYERLGDLDKAKGVYQKMSEGYAPDTKEYEFAQAKLKGEI